MATVAPPRPILPEIPQARPPAWVQRIPPRVGAGAVLLVLMLVSLYMRTRIINGEFWMDEGLSVGISSHSLTSIPGVLRHDGSPPLYYLLLHIWMSLFGSSESQTHGLSLLIALLSIPAGMWTAWSLFGRRAGLIAGVLFALNPFITAYAEETRMYTLMTLLGLLATAAFIHAFVHRRRAYLILFAVCQALMLYTHSWGIFYGLGAAVALIPIWQVSDDRRAILRDAVIAFGAAAILFLPWLPTLLYQAAHTGSPWDSTPNLGAPVQISRNLMGGDRATAALVLGSAIGLSALWMRSRRRSPEALAMWAMILMPIGTLGFGWILSHFTPVWAFRYFAPIVAALLLLAALGLARARGLGLIALALTVIFWINPSSFTAKYKSDMRDLSGELAPYLHAGDVVLVAQPEQVPLAWYYMPAGLRYADPTGPARDPQSMNWVDALKRLQHADPRATLASLVASLGPGQRLLFVRPLTEGAQNWQAPWTLLVRRRAAEWGQALAADPSLRPVPGAFAPHNYRGACCVADSALLYQKT
jgi:4-amino-4-deoxy-L-arabinose transferase-like glycosyltransferase